MRIGLALGLIAAALVSPSNTLASEAELDHRLAATNVISGDKPSVMDVFVPDTSRIRNPYVSGGDGFSISGSGQFVGFALVQRPVGSGQVLVGGRLSKQADSKSFLIDASTFFSDSHYKKSFRLDPGRYWLFLFPGSDYASVSLNIEGLTGTTSLRPTKSLDFQQLELARKSPPGVGNYWAAGGTSRLDGRGLVLALTWMKTEAHAATHAETCFWRNEPRDPGGYLPTCTALIAIDPGNYWGGGSSTHPSPELQAGFKLYYDGWQPFKSGFSRPGLRYGTSVVIKSGSLVDEIGALGLWITYPS